METLQALIYETATASPALEYTLGNLSNVRISWSIPGGVDNIEFDCGMSQPDAFAFARTYLGHRLAIIDHFVDKPVAEGNIYTIGINSSGVHVVGGGLWKRHYDRYFTETPNELWSTTDLIKYVNSDYIQALSNVTYGLQETNTVIGFWQPPDEGIFPGDLIQQMAAVSDSQNRQWSYWIQSRHFIDGLGLQKPMPYFQPQVNDGTFDWEIGRDSISSDSLFIARDITGLVNNVQVVFTMVANTTASNPETWLSVTTAGTDSTSQSDYWTREYHMTGGRYTEDTTGGEVSTLAVQLRDLYLDKYKEPMLSGDIAIKSPKILDDRGNRWPLWTPIKNGGGYLRINDLFPESEMFEESWDRLRIGQIMEMDYSSSDNTLTIRLDTESNAVDAMLARAEFFGG